jgi:CheY-like chemotaxis protein
MGHHAYRVLVADDEYAYREGIARILAPLGCACVAVEDGLDAAALLADEAEEFHIAVTDFHMLRGSGWRVVEAARRHRGPAFPVIMQTAEAQYRDVYERAELLGVPLIAKRDIFTHLAPAVRAALRIRI